MEPIFGLAVIAFAAWLALRLFNREIFDSEDDSDDEPIDDDEKILNSVGMLKEYRAKKEAEKHSKNKSRGLIRYMFDR